MQVSLYNLFPAGLDMLQRLSEAEKRLHPGVKIAIIEPFFKLRADGTHGVRVDDPRDVRLLIIYVKTS